MEGLAEVQVPSLCEVWNWQGDTSVLPFKFESVLNAASEDCELFVASELKTKYTQGGSWDPMGFFFLTYRSQTIGLAFALSAGNGIFEIPYLVCVPSFLGKGVE